MGVDFIHKRNMHSRSLNVYDPYNSPVEFAEKDKNPLERGGGQRTHASQRNCLTLKEGQEVINHSF